MVWNADPVIVTLGPLTIRWYGLLFIVGFLIAFEGMKRIFRRDGYPTGVLDSLLVHIMLGTIIGARLGHCLFYEPGYFLSHPLEIFAVWKGGLASHGGFIGVFVGTWLFARKQKMPFLYLLDKVSMFALLSGAFIRLGNFMNSEIIGKPTDVPWAVVFSRIDPNPRHPTQLYESLAYFLVSLSALAIERRAKGKLPIGFSFGYILTFGFLARFIIEFFKENQEAFEQSMTLNMGQLLSLLPVAIGIVLLFGSWKNRKTEPETKKKKRA